MNAIGQIELNVVVTYIADSSGINVTGLKIYGIAIPLKELTCEDLLQLEEIAKDDHAAFLRAAEETRHESR